MSELPRLKERLNERLGQLEEATGKAFEAAFVSRENVLDALKIAKESGFDFLSDLFAIDFLPREPRFEIVYNLTCTQTGERFLLILRLADGETYPSATGVFAMAGWPEREIFDMFGITADGHTDLRRILLYDTFEGHPLRKDFPLGYQVERGFFEEVRQTPKSDRTPPF